MAVDLTPRIYDQKLKWNILPKNVIDTISIKPVKNTIKESSEELDSRDITSGTVGNTSVTLPMADNITAVTKSSLGYTDRKTDTWYSVMASYGIRVSMLEGTYDIDLQSPVEGELNVTYELEGETTYLDRGDKTVDDINNNRGVGMFAYIESNKKDSEDLVDNKAYDTNNRGDLNDGLILDFTQGWVPMFAWVRATTGSVPSGMTVNSYLTSKYRPKEYDVLTIWNNDDGNDWLPPYDNWIQNGSTFVRQGPYRWYLGNSSENSNKLIPISDTKMNIECSVTKVNDYKLRVYYKIPVRYGYMAAAKAVGSFIHTVEQGRDSYGFKVVVSKITITVSASHYDEDTVDLSYSRVNDNTLTEDAVNNNVLSFDSNSFITLGTYWSTSDKLWTQEMSKYILNKYKDGKYIVECTVPIWWAMKNNITINSEINIKLQDGTYINRNGTTCTFQVKTIEKTFKNNSFVYSLRLLET